MATLRGRFILSHILPILLVMPLMGVLFIFLLESEVILVNLSIQLERQANLIAEFVADRPQLWTDPVAAKEVVDCYDPLLTAKLSLVQAVGRLLAINAPADNQQIGQYIADAGLTVALGGIPHREIHYSQDLNAEVADIFVPVFSPGGEVIGVIRLTQELSPVYTRFRRVRSIVLWILTSGLLLGIGIGIMLATVMERPLVALTQRIAQIARSEGTLVAHPEHFPLPERGPKEIRLLISSFNQMSFHLHTLEAERRHLLANLIHELGRPLGALRAVADALLGGANGQPQLRQNLLVGMDGEIQRLQRLLDDLAHLSQQVAAPQALVRQPVDMAVWLHTTLSPWREEAYKRGIAWQEHLPETLPVLLVDPDRLGQALGNLLSNAIKYTPSRGTISVEAATTALHLAIHVSDTGPGIPLHEQPHIFEPFYRVQASSARGLGIGLPIAAIWSKPTAATSASRAPPARVAALPSGCRLRKSSRLQVAGCRWQVAIHPFTLSPCHLVILSSFPNPQSLTFT